MKFKKTRLLSLLLVLAMVLALVPSVFALTTGTIQFDNALNSALTVGQEVATVATCSAAESEEGHTITYAVKDNSDKVTIVNGKLTAVHAGTVTITAKCSCAASDAAAAEKELQINKKSLNPTITIDNFNVKTDTSESDVKQQLVAKYTDAVKGFADKDVLTCSTWALPEGTNFANTADTALTYTAKVTVAETYRNDYEMTEKNLSVTVTFKNAPQIKTATQKVSNAAGALVDGSTLECGVGATDKKLSVAVTTEPTENITLSYQWLSGTTYSATAEGYTERSNTTSTFTLETSDTSSDGRKYFACKITATNADGLKDEKLVQFTVNVNAPYTLTVTRTDSYTSSNVYVGYTLGYAATLKVYDPTSGLADKKTGYRAATTNDYASIVFSASTDGYVTVAPSTATTATTASVYLYGVDTATPDSSTVTITATVNKKDGSGTLITASSNATTFYPITTSDVLIQPTSSNLAYMDEDSLLYAVRNAYSSAAKPTFFKFASSNGTFNNSNAYTSYATSYVSSTYKVNNTTFTPGYAYTNFINNPTATFYASNDSGSYIVAKGSIKFGTASSISYSTTASTPVYFKASDFTDFYKTAVGGTYSSYYTPSLSYVTFGTPRVSTGSATTGSLYYNSSYVYSTTQVPAANLGYVSYTPSSSTNTYTVSIPFTAVGTYSYGSTTRTVSGTVTIKVNDGHVITMLGTDFKSASVWSDILSKHPNTSYVVFTQPQTSVGKLYYGYSSIASKGTLVSYSDRFNNTSYNYSYASTYKSIDGIYFVPAAGCLDTVSITYTAYTSNGAQIGTSDTVSFTVTKKTASAIFNDVTASNTGNWSADAVDFLARNSIVEGSSYSTFNPNGNMTRGDFVLMLYRLAGKPSVSGISNPFTDVKSTDYYYNAILWAYRNNIVTGTTATTFAPKSNITREQIAATLYRMAGSPSTSGYITGYYDYAKVHSYATNAMKWAVSNGYITGSSGYLTPTANATRAQVATMLHRYLTK